MKNRVSSRTFPLLAAAVLSGCVLATPGTALAAFTQATCSTGAFGTPVPVALGATRYPKQTKTPLQGADDMVRYNFSTDSGLYTLTTNSNVTTLQPYLGYFATEATYDWMKITDGTGGVVHTYSGLLNLTNTPTATADTWLTGANPGTGRAGFFWFRFYSDYTVANYTPPSFAQLAPKCSASQVTTAAASTLMLANNPYEGVLISSGDTLYFRVYQPANVPMVVTLDNLASTAGADFDLYVSTSTTTPDDSNYTWRGFNSGANEALQIPTSASGRTLYVGVHSYSGAGHFMLHPHLTNTRSSNICITNSTLSSGVTLFASQITTLKAALKAGSASMFAWTNGNVWTNAYNLISWPGDCNTASGCDICIVNDAPNNVSSAYPIAGYPCGHLEIHGGNWGGGAAAGAVMAHEWGHACFSMGDEYDTPPAGDSSPRWCGHTNMANNSKALGFCSIAHCSHGSTTNASCSSVSAGWQAIQASGSFTIRGTAFYSSGITPDPTPMWNNAPLGDLVTFNF